MTIVTCKHGYPNGYCDKCLIDIKETNIKTEYYDLNIELLDQVVALLQKAYRDFNHDKSDYQKDLVLAKQGIGFLLCEYAEQLKKLTEEKIKSVL